MSVNDVRAVLTAAFRQPMAEGLERLDRVIAEADRGLAIATEAANSGSAREVSRATAYGSDAWNAAFTGREEALRVNLNGIGSDKLAAVAENLQTVKYLGDFPQDDLARAAATHFAEAGALARSVENDVGYAIRQAVKLVAH